MGRAQCKGKGRSVVSAVLSVTLALGLCPIVAYADEGGRAPEPVQGTSLNDEIKKDAEASSNETSDKIAKGKEASAESPSPENQDLKAQGKDANKDQPAAAQMEKPVSEPAGEQEAAPSASNDKDASAAELSHEDPVAVERDLSTLDIPASSETAPVVLERPDGMGVAASAHAEEEQASIASIDEEPLFEMAAQKTATIDGVTYTYQNTTGEWGKGVYITDATWTYMLKIPAKIDGVDVVYFDALPANKTGQMYHLDASGAPSLQYINTQGLMSIDVSNNPKLRALVCAEGTLDSLDVSGCPALKSLVCSYNRLTKLDVSKNPNLEVLYCGSNFLTHLDLSNNKKLSNKQRINVQLTYNLLDNAKALEARFGTELDTGDLYDGTMAAVLPQCYKTKEGLVYRADHYWNTNADNSNVKVVGYVGSSKQVTIPKTLPVRFDSKQTWNIKVSSVDLVFGRTNSRTIESLDASKATELTQLWCGGWDLRALALPKSSSKLIDLDCDQNNLGSLDLSGLPNLAWLYCAGNNLTALDVSKNPKLINLSCGKEVHYDLGDEVLRGNDLVNLDLSANPNIEYLICDSNGLSSVDVSSCARLLNFNCSGNSITGLSVAKNPRLEMLYCQDNLLTKLDVAANKQIKRFRCYNNYMTDTKTLTDRFGKADKVVLPQYENTPPSRLAGNIALDTMAAITKQGFDSSDTVIIATMGGYWDALAASSLAGVYNCPILLTDESALSAQTASEIKRLKASKVYIAGGTAAVSSKVESALKGIAGVKSVKRLAGNIAINTALEIYKEGKGSWGTTAVVATSETFQDALSVSPYGFAKRAPIFLANATTHTLDPQVISAIKDGGFERIVIVGGTAALSSQIESQQLKGFKCIRLAGPTAYETSGAIASWCLEEGMTVSNMGIATGDSYYDALAGAAFCGKNNSALVLVSDYNHSNVNGFMKANKATVKHAYVFGGPAAVSPKTYGAITGALR